MYPWPPLRQVIVYRLALLGVLDLRQHSITRIRLLMLLPILAGITFAATTFSAGAQDVRDMQVHFGSQIFKLFCVGCHGVDGRGNPPVSRALMLNDVDLTTIAQRSNGDFSSDEVKSAITGLDDTGHARVKMAPWAQMFAEEFDAFAAGIAVDELVDRRLDHLVAYIESIQVE